MQAHAVLTNSAITDLLEICTNDVSVQLVQQPNTMSCTRLANTALVEEEVDAQVGFGDAGRVEDGEVANACMLSGGDKETITLTVTLTTNSGIELVMDN